MENDPRVEPLAKRMCDAMWAASTNAWDVMSDLGKNSYRAQARLALSLIDARDKVARQVLDYNKAACAYHRCPVCEREHAEAKNALDALARELEPEPKEPTLVEAVEAYLRVWPEHGDALKDMRAALARAKGGQS